MTYSTASSDSELARLKELLSREEQSRLNAESLAKEMLGALHTAQKEVQLLQEIAFAASEQSSLEDALRFALARVCAYTGWPAGRVRFWQEEGSGKTAAPAAVWYVSDPALWERLGPLSKESFLPPGDGLPGRVAASGEAAWISNVTQEEECPGMSAARECGMQAVLAFPVLAGKEIAAVLEFFSPVTAEPDAGLLRVMRQVGIQMGRVLERRRYEDKLLYDAFHDPLTQLPNRALFLDRLTQCGGRSKRRPDYKFAVLFIDVDRFKMVNDSLGHDAGDRLIVEIAQRLRRTIRREDLIARPAGNKAATRPGVEDTLARMGGDEFTILLEDIRDCSDSVRVAERIQQTLASPFLINGQEVFTTAGIGIALSTTGYTVAEDMLRDAETAMHRAKSQGKAQCEIFDPAMHVSAVRRLKLESDLRRAIEREEFRVHYQPIVSLQDGRIAGFEALLRWQRPESGMVTPGEFIAVAEETGLIVLIGRWVMREACRQMHAWNLQFPSTPPLTMAVNISAKQFAQPDLVSQVRQVLQETGLAPPALKLEITESVIMSDAQRTCRLFDELKALGIRLSIDDFGTGYSSLSYLRRFPLDTLKIDRSFISGMETNRTSGQIVDTIMTLARNLGMEVVAEGTETAEQVDYLKTLGCEYAQGYFFSKPLDREGVVQEVFARAPER
ncbi:MAG: EAL domain-containing protein [Acidobacteriia bacterium]|nr:EAL domain-containing protein [Terriglobia bacterium]